MPRGPKGKKRPAEVIGAAFMVAKIAMGDIEGTTLPRNRTPPRTSRFGRGCDSLWGIDMEAGRCGGRQGSSRLTSV